MLFEKIQLESDEKIIRIVNKHWFVVLSHGIGIAMVALVPLIGWVSALIFLSNNQTFAFELTAYTSYFVYFYSVWLLFCWIAFAYMWTTYHLDVWVITDRRVIVIDQISLFRRTIGSFRLEKLQDVNIEINGILATFLGFGTVECETASGSHEAEFKSNNLPNPRTVKSDILKASDIRMQKLQHVTADIR